MSITWNTGLAAARARHNLKLNKNKKIKKKVRAQTSKPSSRPQAPKRIVYDVDTLQVLGYYRKEK